MREGYIYILSNKTDSTLYIGVTNNLLRRVQEHKDKIDKTSFSSRYNLSKLLYYEFFDKIEDAIQREKQLKKWSRKKKEFLISTINSKKEDLYETLF